MLEGPPSEAQGFSPWCFTATSLHRFAQREQWNVRRHMSQRIKLPAAQRSVATNDAVWTAQTHSHSCGHPPNSNPWNRGIYFKEHIDNHLCVAYNEHEIGESFMNYKEEVKLIKALADENRLAILEMLQKDLNLRDNNE